MQKIANFLLIVMDIKEKGYRLNVGIIVANSDGKFFQYTQSMSHTLCGITPFILTLGKEQFTNKNFYEPLKTR